MRFVMTCIIRLTDSIFSGVDKIYKIICFANDAQIHCTLRGICVRTISSMDPYERPTKHNLQSDL